jgi:cytochrome c oxidase subunit I+III
LTTATDRLREVWYNPVGLAGLSAVNHRTVGVRFLVTAFVFFLLAGVEALLIRTQLAVPNNDFLGPSEYNRMFTMHGTTMMFLFAVPIMEGFAMYLLPLMFGARDMPFPRLNAYGYYCFLFGGVLVYSGFIFGTVPEGGWFAYVPLTREFMPDKGMDFWLLGITFIEISAIAAAIEIIVGTFKLRAPGMALHRMPLFAWNMLAVAFAILFAFPPLVAGSLMLEFDRAFGTHIYNVALGGDPVLWQHLFWIFGHPEVYIIFLPAAGFVSMIIPAFARRRMVAYILVAFAAIATAFLSFGLWVHHMFAAGLPLLPMAFFTGASLAIAIPSGLQVFAWIATLWVGRPVLKTPLLFILGFLVIFVVGGITGVMVAIVPFDWQVHDTFFVVAHFHYVLIGGAVFPLFAAFHYWLPKVTGKLLNEKLGVVSFALMFVGFNVTFFPMHILGLMGMPRRVYTFESGLGWDVYNLVATVGAFIIAVSVLVFIANFIVSQLAGEDAGDDPWQANTLEWATTSPPAPYNFRSTPVVRSGDPLWDQETVYEDYEGRPMPRILAEAPDGRRYTMVTTALDAEPEYVAELPAPSYWPLVAALGTATIFVGVLTQFYPAVPVGGIVLALSLVGWFWPVDDDNGRGAAEERERRLGLVLRESGYKLSSNTGYLAMALYVLALAAALAALVFSYFMLWLRAEEWPLDGLAAPGFAFAIPGLLILLLSAGASYLAHRTGLTDRRRAFVATLAANLLLGLAFLVLLGVDLLLLDFGATTNAFGSIFFITTLFVASNVFLAMLLTGWALFMVRRGRMGRGSRVPVENAALYWYFNAASWAVVIATVYLMPYLGTPAGVRL